jgi:hypothetical protein
MGEIDEELIERGAQIPEKKSFHTGRIIRYMPWAGSAAACLLIVTVLSLTGVLRFSGEADRAVPESALPAAESAAESAAEIAAAAAEEAIEDAALEKAAVEEAVIEEGLITEGGAESGGNISGDRRDVADAQEQQSSTGYHGGVSSEEAEADGTSDVTADEKEVPLYYNSASSQLGLIDSKIGDQLFWHQLDSTQLRAIFPNVLDTQTVTATATYNGDTPRLMEISAQISSLQWSAEGLGMHVHIAKGEPLLCYLFDSDTTHTDVNGTIVMAGVWVHPRSNETTYFASWKMGDLGYYGELSDYEVTVGEAGEIFSRIVNLIISGGAADWNALADPVAAGIPIPELLTRSVTLPEAQADSDFGSYIPESVPEGFVYESGLRLIDQDSDTLQVSWSKGLNYLSWKVGMMRPELRDRTTGVAERENYDLSLYPIPMAESVPEELRQIVDHPIFLYDEMTLDTVYARSRYIDNDQGDVAGYRIDFGVLLGDTLIEITAKGITPEKVWEMLQNVAEDD